MTNQKTKYIYGILDHNENHIKIGETTHSTINPRLKQLYPQKNIETLLKIGSIEIVFFEELPHGKTDKQFHKYLEVNKGITPSKLGGEWFTLSEEYNELFYYDMIEEYIGGRPLNNFSPRNEQREAINRMTSWYKTDDKTFLLAAKPRYGKTFTFYNFMKEAELNHTLVITYKPIAGREWASALKTHEFFQEYEYYHIDRSGDYKIDKDKKQVFFASMQFILNHYDNEESYFYKEIIKNSKLFDIIGFDESHFGETSFRLQKFHDTFNKYRKDEVKTVKMSGTAFKALMNFTGENFNELNSYSWDYNDEQEAKIKYERTYGSKGNPYSVLPRIEYNVFEDDDGVYDFNRLFKVSSEDKKFVFEDQVVDFTLKVLTGPKNGPLSKKGNIITNPSNEIQNRVEHSLILMNSTESCTAYKDLLETHPDLVKLFSDYSILDLGAEDSSIGEKAADDIMANINNKEGKKTLTLVYGKGTTSITIPQWSNVIFLRNISSTETFFQTVFRVQSPWYSKVGESTHIYKDIGYVWAFGLEDFINNKIVKVAESSMNSNREDDLYIYIDSLVKHTEVRVIKDFDGESISFSAKDIFEYYHNVRRYRNADIKNINVTHFKHQALLNEINNDDTLKEALGNIFKFRSKSNVSNTVKRAGRRALAIKINGRSKIVKNTDANYSIEKTSKSFDRSYDIISINLLDPNGKKIKEYNFDTNSMLVNLSKVGIYSLKIVYKHKTNGSEHEAYKNINVVSEITIEEIKKMDTIDQSMDDINEAINLIFRSIPTYLKLSNIREGGLEDILLTNIQEYKLFESVTRIDHSLFKKIGSFIDSNVSRLLDAQIIDFLEVESSIIDVYGDNTTIYKVNEINTNKLRWIQLKQGSYISASRKKDQQEVFTRKQEVEYMIDQISEHIDLENNFFEPANGRTSPFIIEYMCRLMDQLASNRNEGLYSIEEFKIRLLEALSRIHGLEIDRENVNIAIDKIEEIFWQKYLEYIPETMIDRRYVNLVRHIIMMNIIEGNAITYKLDTVQGEEDIYFYDYIFEYSDSGVLVHEGKLTFEQLSDPNSEFDYSKIANFNYENRELIHINIALTKTEED